MSMILDLRRFRSPVERVERTFEPASFGSSDEDFRITTPIELGTDVQKDGPKFRLIGTLRTTVEMPCSRCLEPFTTPVDAAFDLMFLPHADAPESDKIERKIHDDDVGVSFYTDDKIDLVEVMREQVYLVLPMKPLCRPDCQGLCPLCGINRNLGTCACKADWVDPRLEVLKDLRPR
jgi:uncharacterized protein